MADSSSMQDFDLRKKTVEYSDVFNVLKYKNGDYYYGQIRLENT